MHMVQKSSGLIDGHYGVGVTRPREGLECMHMVYIRHIFSSNQIVQKISFSLWFWASDLLFDRFLLNLSTKWSEAQKTKAKRNLMNDFI